MHKTKALSGTMTLRLCYTHNMLVWKGGGGRRGLKKYSMRMYEEQDVMITERYIGRLYPLSVEQITWIETLACGSFPGTDMTKPRGKRENSPWC